MSGGAVSVARQNRYMDAFRMAGATSKENAKTLKEIGIVPIGIFRRMVRAGVFEKAGEDRYFMREENAQKFVQRRHQYARLILAIFGIGLLAFYLMYGAILR